MLLALLAGCSDDSHSTRVTPALSSTTPSPSPGSNVGGVPADHVLPGQAEGRVEPPPDVGRLYDHICLDPPACMNTQESRDARTIIVEDRTGARAITIERLVLYRSTTQATKAVRGRRPRWSCASTA